jgi:hypothetical protein
MGLPNGPALLQREVTNIMIKVSGFFYKNIPKTGPALCVNPHIFADSAIKQHYAGKCDGGDTIEPYQGSPGAET